MDPSRFKPELPGLSAERSAVIKAALLDEIDRQMAKSPTRLAAVRRRRSILAPAAAVSAIVALIWLVLTFVISSGPALASWTPTPQSPTEADTTAASVACGDKLRGIKDPGLSGVPEDLAVAEQRGKLTTVVLTSPLKVGFCLFRKGETLAFRRDETLAGTSDLADSAVGTNLTMVTSSRLPATNGSGSARLVVGRLTPVVGAVRIMTEDGRDVRATVAGGWYVAWWPSDAAAVTVIGVDAAGREVGRLNLGEPASPGPPSPRMSPAAE